MEFAKRLAERATAPLKREVERQAVELKHKAASYGIGAALAVAAGVLALFAVVFALVTIAVALALVMPTWTALLIVTGVLFAATGVVGVIAANKLKH